MLGAAQKERSGGMTDQERAKELQEAAKRFNDLVKNAETMGLEVKTYVYHNKLEVQVYKPLTDPDLPF